MQQFLCIQWALPVPFVCICAFSKAYFGTSQSHLVRSSDFVLLATCGAIFFSLPFSSFQYLLLFVFRMVLCLWMFLYIVCPVKQCIYGTCKTQSSVAIVFLRALVLFVVPQKYRSTFCLLYKSFTFVFSFVRKIWPDCRLRPPPLYQCIDIEQVEIAKEKQKRNGKQRMNLAFCLYLYFFFHITLHYISLVLCCKVLQVSQGHIRVTTEGGLYMYMEGKMGKF